MSVESIASLNSEITQLKKQVEDAVNQANGFVAQLDAHKQMLSEVIGNYQTDIFMKQMQNYQHLRNKSKALINN